MPAKPTKNWTIFTVKTISREVSRVTNFLSPQSPITKAGINTILAKRSYPYNPNSLDPSVVQISGLVR